MGKFVEGKKIKHLCQILVNVQKLKLKMVEPWRVSYNPALFSLCHVGSMVRKSKVSQLHLQFRTGI